MTEQESREAKERADLIVKKVRDLVTLEDRVLQARDAGSQDDLSKLEADLEQSVNELDSITDELKWATPCFRAYVLPQMSELVGTLKACDAAGRSELAKLVNSLTKEEDAESLEELETTIINQLKENIDRTFRV